MLMTHIYFSIYNAIKVLLFMVAHVLVEQNQNSRLQCSLLCNGDGSDELPPFATDKYKIHVTL
jgi:hypothetical protein